MWEDLRDSGRRSMQYTCYVRKMYSGRDPPNKDSSS